MLELINIQKDFNNNGSKISALTNISFSLNSGDRVLLYGANGSGKTTLLKCIFGLLLPENGSISFDGEALDLRYLHYSINYKKRVSFISSRIDEFYPRLTLRQNIDFFSFAYFSDLLIMRQRIDSLFNLFHINEYGKVAFQNCSSGIKKRLCLIKGLIYQPEMLLIDEWDSALDTQTSGMFAGYMENSCNTKLSILSSHSISVKDEFFNKVIVLKQGRIIYCDSVNSLIKLADKKNLRDSLAWIINNNE
ncbi:MAG: ABC transporter ATP-binding protein [bacterium]